MKTEAEKEEEEEQEKQQQQELKLGQTVHSYSSSTRAVKA